MSRPHLRRISNNFKKVIRFKYPSSSIGINWVNLEVFSRSSRDFGIINEISSGQLM